MNREQIYKAALEEDAKGRCTWGDNCVGNHEMDPHCRARAALEAAAKVGDDKAKPCTKCGGDGYYYCDESGCEAAHRCRRCKS